MSNFQRVLIIITLSVAVILISGILLPKYLSSQILELRKELNSQNINPKYSLQANLESVAEKHIKNESKDLMSSQSSAAEKLESLLNNSILSSARVRKRSKRQAEPDEHFNWKINFNLTGKRNHAFQDSSEIASDTSKNDKYLDIAVFTEGEAKKKSAFAEIQHHLRVFEYFFKYLLSAENFTQEEELNEHARSGMDLENFDGSGDESPVKGREGKFFNLGSFNIFGFRRSPEKVSSTISAMPETDSAFERNEFTTQLPNGIITDNSNEIPNLSNFQAESLVSEALNINASSTSDLILPGKTEDGECIDCNGVDLELPSTNESIDQTKTDLTEIKTSSTKFTDEFLEMFCMSLVNKVGIAQHLSDSEDSVHKQNIIDENDILRSPEKPVLDFVPTSASKEQNLQFLDENSSINDILSENEIKQKFLSLSSILGFGSGRAAAGLDESNELTSEKFTDVVDLENLPTLIDCENYFRKKNLKMFPKPNLMDIISDPKIQFADFANATISSKLIEQQLEFLTGLLKTNLDRKDETFGKNSKGLFTKSSLEVPENESLPNAVLNEIQIHTEANDLNENSNILNTNTDKSEVQTANLDKDGRFISIFGFGSGNGEPRSLESASDVNEEIGSGDQRLLGTVAFDIDRNELENVRSKSLWASLFGTNRDELGSGSLRSLESAAFGAETNELGSGDLRSLGGVTFETDVNEFGSGAFRSLGNVTPEIERKEFGSGDFRLLQDVASEIERKEFGSGDFRSLEDVASEIERKEFGSGELRSFEGVASETERKEFGSGDFRSLEDVASEIERKEFGSGDFRSLEDVASEIERKEFGSGDFRSLEDVTSEIEKKELGSGEFKSLEDATLKFEKEIGSGDFRSLEGETSEQNEFGSGDSFKEPNLYEESQSISPNKQRFWDILGLTGSGDGRELLLNQTSPEEKCENCSLEIITEQLHNCVQSDCNNGNSNESDVNFIEDRDLVKEKGCSEGCFDATSVNNETIIESITVTSDHGKDCQDCNRENFEVFGSGGFRSLEVTTPENARKEFGSGEFSKNASIFVGNEKFSECVECNFTVSVSLEESLTTVPTQELIAIDTNLVTTDENLKTFYNVSNVDNFSTIEQNVPSETLNMIEGPHEQATEKNTERFLVPVFLTGSGDEGLFGDSGGPINLLEEDEGTSVDTISDAMEDKMVSKAQNVNKPHEETTDINTIRFLGPIFLTGSGDGGLFEDSGGPINLLEEESIPSNSSLRGARLNDIPLNVSGELHESSMKQTNQIERPIDNNAVKFTSPLTPSRRGRLDDTTDFPCEDCEYDYEAFIENYRKKQNLDSNKDASKFQKRTNMEPEKKIPQQTNKNATSVTILTDVIRSNIPGFPELSKSGFRSCTAARECNVTLNERCITINSSRVCGCSKGYARNKDTSKCIVKKIVETSIKLPGERFEEDLNNPLSPRFQQKRKSSIELVMLLLQNDPELLRMLSEINVIKFSSGSLIITLNLVFAVENKSEEQLVKHVEDDLQVAIRDETLTRPSSLNVRDAALLSVNGEINYCKSSELNYCSEHAYCVANPALPSHYACHCKEHYRDVSLNPRHFGEACVAKCPKEYCGAFGHCELLANDEKTCLCSGLYFGRRCEVPGLYVLITLAFVGFVSLTMLLLVVFKRRCSRFSYRESQAQAGDESGIHAHMNGRVSDAIALEENVGTMKFVSISTPLPHPAIKVTRPTITESGSSYDFDSTFDSTQSTQKAEEDSTV